MATHDTRPRTDHDGSGKISHPFVAAVYDWVVPEATLFAPQREYLTDDLSGRVLDIGAGTGANFPHVADENGDIEYHAIEPDPHMRRQAETKARESGCAVDLRDARAEALPYPDDAFDVVIAGLVFCTIEEPDTALAEIARVLKPGGEFRFLEHVHADGWQATGQELLNPLWERVAGGCQLNRDTVDRFVCNDAFSVDEIERLSVGLFPATPIVRGRLYRRRDRPTNRSIREGLFGR